MGYVEWPAVQRKVTFFLDDTTVHQFMRWLKHFARKVSDYKYQTEDGRLMLVPSYRPSGDADIPRWSLSGFLAQPSETFEEAEARARSTGDNWLGTLICFDPIQVSSKRLMVVAECTHPAVMSLFEGILYSIGMTWPEAARRLGVGTVHGVQETTKRRRGGHPGLDHNELIYRLAKAQEGNEIRAENPEMTWKEIAGKIRWKYGYDKAGVKLLEDARLHRLAKLAENDPKGILDEVKKYRERSYPTEEDLIV